MPLAGAIAPAQMHADAELGRVSEYPIDDGDVHVDQRARIVAARTQARLHVGVPELRESRLVDLHIATACRRKRVQLAPERRNDVIPELIHIAIGVRGYSRIAAAEMQRAGARNGDL